MEKTAARRQAMLDGAQSRLDAQQNGRAIVKFVSQSVDNLLAQLWHDVAGEQAGDVDLIAVGGYGRAEVCPHSDWDLLFLTADKAGAKYDPLIQRFTQTVWDTGAHLGHAIRSVTEEKRFVAGDHHGRTALIESRLIAGGGKHFTRLMKTEAPQKWGRRRRVDFVRTKLEECRERRREQGNTAFVMEPEVKNGKGSLRDVSTIFWLSMAWYGVPAARELIGQVVDEDEFNQFTRGREFLWRVRSGLHLLAGRENDRLRFEYQPELAKRFRYRDSDKSSAVERFLKNYFLNVRAIADLSDIFLLHFEEQVNPPSRLRGRTRLGGGMEVRRQEVNIYDEKAFAKDPHNVLKIFRLAQLEERHLNSRALRTIRKHASLITAQVRATRAANEIFLEILRSKRNVTTALSQMHETGVLGKFCPDFARITGHGQFDRYHHYTVDAHTIRAIDILRDFRLGETQYIDLPLATTLMAELNRPELLYIALLFHDIAKGRGGDHSVIGEQLSIKFCRRLRLSQDDIDIVSWLVMHHLRLSKTAQHYDLSDPKVISEFAEFVGDRERLVYLFVLTVADVTAVGPGTWTDWKGHLFTQLFRTTEDFLRSGRVTSATQSERITLRKESVLSMCASREKQLVERSLAVISNTLTLHFTPSELLNLSFLIEREYGASVEMNEDSGYTRVWAWALDRPKLFSHLTKALAAANLKVLSAQAYALRDGRVVDLFHITDARDVPLSDAGQIERLQRSLSKVVAGEEPKAIKQPAKLDVLMQHQSVRVRRLDAAAHSITAIEVVAADRKGLLAELAAAIAEAGVNLHGANISTFGEKAVDVFFVTNADAKPLTDKQCDALMAALEVAATLPVSGEEAA